jgi:DNA-binding response OmpR family regulator
LECTIIEAKDGEEALELILNERPDLVVLDVMMPTLSGWELCKYIRTKAELADTRVVMLTAIGKTVNEMTSPLYGADAYLDKPFDIQEIVEVVSSLLASPRES